MATRIPPPKPGTPVPKEYVRQQLKLLGIKNVAEEDLESYAADLTKLIKETSEPPTYHKSVRGSNGVGLSSLYGEGAGAQLQASSQISNVPNTEKRSSGTSPSSPSHSSPESSNQLRGQGSAVFKTFPEDKDNRIHFLSPSQSPTPVRRATSCSDKQRAVSPISLVSSDGEYKKRAAIKRKVLRKCNGESRIFDESLSDLEQGPLAHYLSDLSLTSVSSSDVSKQFPGSSKEKHQVHCCKSFIRPPTTHPHTRGLRRTDPVKRYHHFQQLWANFKPPGERARNSLRWSIREQLMHQDVPYYEPQRRVYRPNEFVVPTEKKRSSLRWEVRHALAHQ